MSDKERTERVSGRRRKECKGGVGQGDLLLTHEPLLLGQIKVHSPLCMAMSMLVINL